MCTSWGRETPCKFTREQISSILDALGDQETYGMVLRAKGMVPAQDGTWIYFDMVPGEKELRLGDPDTFGGFVKLTLPNADEIDIPMTHGYEGVATGVLADASRH